MNGFIDGQVGKFVASPQAARLWTVVNRSLHAQMVKVLSGQSGSAISVVNGQAVLNLGPFIDQATQVRAPFGGTRVERSRLCFGRSRRASIRGLASRHPRGTP